MNYSSSNFVLPRILVAGLLTAVLSLMSGSARADDGGDGAACIAVTAPCVVGDTCCGGSFCGGYSEDGGLRCGYATGACLPTLSACSSPADCCSKDCSNGVCAGDAGTDGASCVAILAPCTAADTCCGGSNCGAYGENGSLACGYATGVCGPEGSACTAAKDCCSQACSGAICVADAGADATTCIAVTSSCTMADQCCNGAYCGAYGPDSSLACGYATGACLPETAKCSSGIDCCSKSCSSGVCVSADGGTAAADDSSDGCSCELVKHNRSLGTAGLMGLLALAGATIVRRRRHAR